jgi:hypothetical protein
MPRRRFCHYDVIDFVAVLLGYAISGERTLETFYERLQPFANAFMALFGRDRLPARSTLSRFLAALDQAPVEALRTVFLEDLRPDRLREGGVSGWVLGPVGNPVQAPSDCAPRPSETAVVTYRLPQWVRPSFDFRISRCRFCTPTRWSSALSCSSPALPARAKAGAQWLGAPIVFRSDWPLPSLSPALLVSRKQPTRLDLLDTDDARAFYKACGFRMIHDGMRKSYV